MSDQTHEEAADALPPSLDLLDGWLTRAQVAEKIGVTSDTLARWETQRSGPPCIRLGRKVLYRIQSFQDWLASREDTRRPARRAGGGR